MLLQTEQSRRLAFTSRIDAASASASSSAERKMLETTVEASSGGGSVTVKMNGQKQVLGIKIDPEVVKAGDLEMLQDLVAAAVNAAGQKVDQAMQSTVGGMLGGIGLM